ncbi:MAG: class I SAM-dependent methyltransferase [Verrucomicrobiales bacterium]
MPDFHSKIAKQVHQDMGRLEQSLQNLIPRHLLQTKNQEEISILNLACGACHEAKTLAKAFRTIKEGKVVGEGESGSKIELVGVDIRKREIAHARENHPGSEAESFHFLDGDATDLSGHAELSTPDVVFLRHQNFWHDPAIWHKIFDQGLARLDESGLLVITSYFDKEHELALGALQKLGAELVRTERTPGSRSLRVEGKSVDRHVAVFRRVR